MARYHDFFHSFRLLFLLVALLIIVASTWFSNRLARDLAQEEQKKIELWAEAIRLLAQEETEDDLQIDYSLTLRIIENNTNIPVILVDESGEVQSYSNLPLSRKHPQADVERCSRELIQKNRSIEVKLSDTVSQYVYYDDSRHLRMLKYFPYVQLAVLFLFFIIVIVTLSLSKRSEQDRVWVGLSKETAHQLGTPISSLLAWEELLKLKNVDPMALAEIEKDTQRLQTIAERFSKIGSKPEPKPEALRPAIENAVRYMQGRTSRQVGFRMELPAEDCFVYLNVPLFEWVIENLFKNAVDAMNGSGQITVHVSEEHDQVALDVSDTGKGIPKNRYKSVFKPGYTTKERGWGLGLSLVKRIVEEYHGGKIFVKSSELGKGTTFRILLKKAVVS